MSPYEQALNVYRTEPCARTFENDLAAHLQHGYVLNTPTVFVMCRPVRRSASPERIVNPWVYVWAPDCWHFYLYAGSLIEGIKHLPYFLPYCSFERNNKLRFYRFDRLLLKLQKSLENPCMLKLPDSPGEKGSSETVENGFADTVPQGREPEAAQAALAARPEYRG